eukprot:CAMPEP_0116854708 /NCGR_PEP_ID=MMETSP0418-20121206/18785_1 /TAXON_ID=1158023 /ORGANISM="Astrosyne radiata, Strain 13vi08-1A" /LENGTH=65 /DNA_ID=CAMNT_0004487585 /DNA_START=8 /DNA_END=205 /DNA_ORIENTATION=-
MRDDDWETHEAGQVWEGKDEHWERRFGATKTCWAGTTEHSLSDWHARRFIWDLFDSQLHGDASQG